MTFSNHEDPYSDHLHPHNRRSKLDAVIQVVDRAIAFTSDWADAIVSSVCVAVLIVLFFLIAGVLA